MMGLSIGLLHVRRSIYIDATPHRVWDEFTSFEKICRWLNLGHTIHALNPVEGGSVDMSVLIDEEPRHYGGQVVVVEPGRELSFEVNWRPPHAWPASTFWTIRLSPVYAGTMVELLHHGFERLGVKAGSNLLGYEQGWDVKHLAALREIVERSD